MKILKGAVIFLLGAGCGASASYVYFKKLYHEKKGELEEMIAHYSAKAEHDADVVENTRIVKRENYVSYDNIDKKELGELIRDRSESALYEDRPVEGYPEEPVEITDEDYSERELYFDKIEADYYIEDGCLVDENDELIQVEDTIGFDNLTKFLDDESEDVMYIRNAPLATDYMVKKAFGKFNDNIGAGGDDND